MMHQSLRNTEYNPDWKAKVDYHSEQLRVLDEFSSLMPRESFDSVEEYSKVQNARDELYRFHDKKRKHILDHEQYETLDEAAKRIFREFPINEGKTHHTHHFVDYRSFKSTNEILKAWQTISNIACKFDNMHKGLLPPVSGLDGGIFNPDTAPIENKTLRCYVEGAREYQNFPVLIQSIENQWHVCVMEMEGKGHSYGAVHMNIDSITQDVFHQLNQSLTESLVDKVTIWNKLVPSKQKEVLSPSQVTFYISRHPSGSIGNKEDFTRAFIPPFDEGPNGFAHKWQDVVPDYIQNFWKADLVAQHTIEGNGSYSVQPSF